MIVIFKSVIRRFIAGYKNMDAFYIRYGSKETENRVIPGNWMKPISRTKESGIISIER